LIAGGGGSNGGSRHQNIGGEIKCFALSALIVTSRLATACWTNIHLWEGDGHAERIALLCSTFDGEAADPSNGYDACATIWSPP
jgi:hypothetical protein